jgi:hypothetical protein
VAARAVVEFLHQHGGAKAYACPDYPTELSRLKGFDDIEAIRQPVTLLLSPSEFAGLTLSSSHAREAIEKFGRANAESDARRHGCRSGRRDGKVPFGYSRPA